MTFAAEGLTLAIEQMALIMARINDPIPFFDYVGATEKQRVRERIMHTKIDPDGAPWLPWAPFTAEHRDALGNSAQGIMWDSGTLLNSIEFSVDGTFGVDVGTDVWYAPKHQDGSPSDRIPARPIFGWEENVIPQMAQMFVNFVEGAQL